MSHSEHVSNDTGKIRLVSNFLYTIVHVVWNYQDSKRFGCGLCFYWIWLSNILLVLCSLNSVLKVSINQCGIDCQGNINCRIVDNFFEAVWVNDILRFSFKSEKKSDPIEGYFEFFGSSDFQLTENLLVKKDVFEVHAIFGKNARFAVRTNCQSFAGNDFAHGWRRPNEHSILSQ